MMPCIDKRGINKRGINERLLNISCLYVYLYVCIYVGKDEMLLNTSRYLEAYNNTCLS